MRIRIFPFKDGILTQGIRSLSYSGFIGGEVICLPDKTALRYIEEKLAERFDYSIPDNEIRRLYDDFISASSFNKKVEIFISALSMSVSEAILEDGTEIRLTVTPKNPSEWLQYNSKLIQFYKSKFPENTVEGLKKSFNEKCINSPDYNKVIDSELIRIDKLNKDDNSRGIAYWYNEKYIGNVPKDESVYKLLLSSSIHHGVENFVKGEAYAEYESYLKSNSINNSGDTIDRKEIVTTFPNLFISEEKYQEIMSVLVKEKFCQEVTFIWKDSKKGTKSFLASLIKHLHSKGYYIKYPTNDEVLLVAKNSFMCDLGIDTVKRAKIDSYNFDFIPESR